MLANFYGDAIRETSTLGTGNSSWQGDYSYFCGLYRPFTFKGRSLWDSSYAGRFSFGRNNGSSVFDAGFRSVVIPIV